MSRKSQNGTTKKKTLTLASRGLLGSWLL